MDEIYILYFTLSGVVSIICIFFVADIFLSVGKADFLLKNAFVLSELITKI